MDICVKQINAFRLSSSKRMKKMLYSSEHHSVLLDHNEISRLCNIIFYIFQSTIDQLDIVPHLTIGYNKLLKWL